MADIELVIKIPEEIYKHILSMQFYIPGSRSGKSLLEKILKAIRTGTPLPKGHGDLIDAGELRLDIIAHKYSNNFCEEHNIDQSINVGMLNILIADAPTIIEADKAESEDKYEM